jgi:hypothetical protein
MIVIKQFSPHNSKLQFKKKSLKFNFPMWQMITAKTSIKEHIYHYAIQCEMVICDTAYCTNKSNSNFLINF